MLVCNESGCLQGDRSGWVSSAGIVAFANRHEEKYRMGSQEGCG
jgi:hypothetical protein